MVAMQQIARGNGRNFHSLNKTLIALLTKKYGASHIVDFGPVSLLHKIPRSFPRPLRFVWALFWLISSPTNKAILFGDWQFKMISCWLANLSSYSIRGRFLWYYWSNVMRAFNNVSWRLLLNVMQIRALRQGDALGFCLCFLPLAREFWSMDT